MTDDPEPAHIPEAAALARVSGLDGTELELRRLWADRPAVVAWLRHFG